MSYIFLGAPRGLWDLPKDAGDLSNAPTGPNTAPRFGDLIENGWASHENPHRFGTFVRAGRRTGRLNPGPYWELTDREGKFWECPLDKGHKLVNHGPAAERTKADSQALNANEQPHQTKIPSQPQGEGS